MTDESATRVLGGRYELTRLLGRGAVGEVHCAHDRVLGRDVAVKLFRGGLGVDGDSARREAEMRLLAALTHPHVVPAYDAGEDDGTHYLVMQLVDGATLAQRLPLPPDEVRRIGLALASALAHVHAQGVVHRDVKPANVLLAEDGGVWLSDFGIAKLLDAASATATGVTIGTASYLSPEQVQGREVGPASDVYALGLVLLEALTGRRAYDGETIEAALARLHRRPVVPPDLPRPWPTLLEQMTADEPAQRPAADEVVRRLTVAAGTTATTTLAPAPPVTRALPDPEPAPRASPAPPAAGRGVLTEVLLESMGARVVQVAAGALALVALVITVAVTASTGGDEDAARTPAAAAAPRGGGSAPLAVKSARLFHPGGSGSDYARDVPLAVDGNPGTAWTSQRYSNAAFGSLRPGVGVLYDLGKAVSVTELRLQLPHPGASLRIYAGDDPSDALLRTKPRATLDDAPGATRIAVRDRSAARYWVVWFARLPESGQRRAGIAETVFTR